MELLKLSDRDLFLRQIENQLTSKRKMLLDKKSRFDKLKDENIFLQKIRNNYQKYHNYILEQKIEELNAIANLKKYTDDLMSTNDLTKEKIIKTKNNQRELIKEMDKIQKFIDNINHS
jgi:hypothetical protein